ncbi:helix-turn-helix domain-containing protein [Streptomyces sp. CA-111067]|uniref:helix-turn-helix domain-containing protein n=1 Tax=Streptomyces sp. CA-111067 TaxID=3240046 RepID=UPI003D99C602
MGFGDALSLTLAAAVGISEQLMGEIESGWRSATPANLARMAATLQRSWPAH